MREKFDRPEDITALVLVIDNFQDEIEVIMYLFKVFITSFNKMCKYCRMWQVQRVISLLSLNLYLMAFISVCSLKKSEGKCPLEAKVERWFYKSGVCKMFLYSGCGGNANSFATKEECYGTCGNICLQPAEKGNEKQNHTR